MFDEHTEAARRQGAAVEVEQIHLVETEQISLYFTAVLIEQAAEAD
jgi:hypothetical protein